MVTGTVSGFFARGKIQTRVLSPRHSVVAASDPKKHSFKLEKCDPSTAILIPPATGPVFGIRSDMLGSREAVSDWGKRPEKLKMISK